MSETTGSGATKKRKTSAAKKSSTAKKPRKTVAKKGAAKETTPVTNTAITETNADHRSEAKSRFNAALEEAKAGAAALKAEGQERAAAYRGQAKSKGDDWVAEAKAYGADAKVKGKELATEGKVKTSDGMRTLSRTISENAHQVDEKLGAKYGDYARSASTALNDYAAKLDEKSVDDLVEDGREFVRKSPGTAIGIAAVAGFLLSRLFRR
ncbi:hypothetical protein K3163_07295 [Qipengyuania sp. 1NDW9]|uniref:DUF883 domain-containing protein n=1 Tax=Qipengyuania xiapuensis TaxID=2867236 RepID=A0ABX8ZVP1_9SPHN|nr:MULTISPECIES: hypothetical protein [Qipengyuania]MBX7493010.1 hypothetical protein [Qipengyuania xiapuensis]MBY6128634.1 hypothetical protein [Qipengyuania aquimaris]QZD92836.1 hypothetical protein K3162_01970 [Qipengyuania xiapuensis]